MFHIKSEGGLRLTFIIVGNRKNAEVVENIPKSARRTV